MEREARKGQATTLEPSSEKILHAMVTAPTPHRYMSVALFLLQTPDKQAFMFGAMSRSGRGAYVLNIGYG